MPFTSTRMYFLVRIPKKKKTQKENLGNSPQKSTHPIKIKSAANFLEIAKWFTMFNSSGGTKNSKNSANIDFRFILHEMNRCSTGWTSAKNVCFQVKICRKWRKSSSQRKIKPPKDGLDPRKGQSNFERNHLCETLHLYLNSRLTLKNSCGRQRASPHLSHPCSLGWAPGFERSVLLNFATRQCR